MSKPSFESIKLVAKEYGMSGTEVELRDATFGTPEKNGPQHIGVVWYEYAPLIVTAVNAHSALVEAARLAETELRAWSNSHSFVDVHDEGNDYSKALKAIHAALALAEQKDTEVQP